MNYLNKERLKKEVLTFLNKQNPCVTLYLSPGKIRIRISVIWVTSEIGTAKLYSLIIPNNSYFILTKHFYIILYHFFILIKFPIFAILFYGGRSTPGQDDYVISNEAANSIMILLDFLSHLPEKEFV